MSNEGSSVDSLEKLATMSNQDIKEKIDEVLQKFSVDNLVKVMGEEGSANMQQFNEMRNELSPTMLNSIESMAHGDVGKKIKEKMSKEGKSPQQLMKELKKLKKEQNKKQKSATVLSTYKVVLLHNRKLEEKIVNSLEHEEIASLIKRSNKDDVVANYCYEIQMGPLKDVDVYVWHDSKVGTIDRLAKSLLGYPLGGKIVFTARDGNLRKCDLETILQLKQ